MKRDPTIHIKESDLYQVLDYFKYLFKGDTMTEFVQEISKKCKPLSCSNRAILATNQKDRKKVDQILQSNKGDADLVAHVIYAIRIKLNHRGVRKVNEGDRDWLQIKELANICNQFCKDLDLPKREGYIKYLENGLGRLKSMRAYPSKLISMYESIAREVQDKEAMSKEGLVEKAMEIHDLYVAAIASRTGLFESYKDQPSKMLSFARIAELCDSLGCDYKTYIDAQFDFLSFCNGIPAPEHMEGEKGKERLNKFLFKNNIQLNQKPPSKTDWGDIIF